MKILVNRKVKLLFCLVILSIILSSLLSIVFIRLNPELQRYMYWRLFCAQGSLYWQLRICILRNRTVLWKML